MYQRDVGAPPRLSREGWVPAAPEKRVNKRAMLIPRTWPITCCPRVARGALQRDLASGGTRGGFLWREIAWGTSKSVAKTNQLVRIPSPLFVPPQQLVPCPILQELSFL